MLHVLSLVLTRSHTTKMHLLNGNKSKYRVKVINLQRPTSLTVPCHNKYKYVLLRRVHIIFLNKFDQTRPTQLFYPINHMKK